jgi:hypothetical protein
MAENNKKIKPKGNLFLLSDNSRSNNLISNNSNSVKENSVSKPNTTNYKYSEEVKKHNDSMTSAMKKNYASNINTSKNEAKNSSINQYPIFNVNSQDPENNNNNMLIINNESVQTVSKEEIRGNCMKMFMNYAKFSSVDKSYYLNQQNLIKLLKELNVLNNSSLKTSDIDIIFKKVNTFEKKIYFQQFMDTLVHISKKIDPEGFKNNQKDCIRDLVLNMWNYFSRDQENSEILSHQQEESVVSLNQSKNFHNLIENFVRNFEIDNKMILMVNDIYYTIKEIYTVYFNSELSNHTEKNKLLNNSFEGLTEFVREFEIIPYLCNMSNIIIYWDYLINLSSRELTKNKSKPELFDEKRDLGKFFTLSKFSSLLVFIGVFSFNKYNPLSINIISDAGKSILTKKNYYYFLKG